MLRVLNSKHHYISHESMISNARAKILLLAPILSIVCEIRIVSHAQQERSFSSVLFANTAFVCVCVCLQNPVSMYLCRKMGVLILSLFCRYCGTHRLHMLISSLSIAFTLSVLCGLCTICTCVCVCVYMCVRVSLCVCVLLIFLCQRMRKSIHNSVYVCMLLVCEQKHIFVHLYAVSFE